MNFNRISKTIVEVDLQKKGMLIVKSPSHKALFWEIFGLSYMIIEIEKCNVGKLQIF